MPTMLAARFHGPRDLRLEQVPVPDLGAHDVLCRVSRSGLCGTDYAIHTGELSLVKDGSVRFPLTPGHEWSGVVAAVGPKVRTLAIGDRVTGDTAVACGHCNRCLLGQYYDCPEVRSVGTVNAWDGAHAQFIMMPERHIFRLPERVDLDNGALVEPAATALAAVTRAGVALGDTVLVQGSGPVGLAAARLAQLSGAAQVIVAGRQDPKLRLARDLGADAVVNTTAEPLAQGVARLAAPYPVDRVIEASGSLDLLREALALVRPGGTVSAVAFYDEPLPEMAVDRLVFANASLRGVAGSLGMYPTVLKLMDLGLLDLRGLITARYPLAHFARALAAMKAPGAVKVMIEP